MLFRQRCQERHPVSHSLSKTLSKRSIERDVSELGAPHSTFSGCATHQLHAGEYEGSLYVTTCLMHTVPVLQEEPNALAASWKYHDPFQKGKKGRNVREAWRSGDYVVVVV